MPRRGLSVVKRARMPARQLHGRLVSYRRGCDWAAPWFVRRARAHLPVCVCVCVHAAEVRDTGSLILRRSNYITLPPAAPASPIRSERSRQSAACAPALACSCSFMVMVSSRPCMPVGPDARVDAQQPARFDLCVQRLISQGVPSPDLPGRAILRVDNDQLS